MKTIPSISELIKSASVFKTLAYLDFEITFIEEKKLFLTFQRGDSRLYVYLDSTSENYQLINLHGKLISPVECLVAVFSVNHFNAERVGETLQAFIDQEYQGETLQLVPTDLQSVLIALWKPRKKKNKIVQTDRPASIEALHPDRGYQSCIQTNIGQQKNLLFLIDKYQFQPFFQSSSALIYGPKETQSLVVLNSYNDILFGTQYAAIHTMVVLYTETPDYLTLLEGSREIILPIATDLPPGQLSNAYYRQKVRFIILVINQYSPFQLLYQEKKASFSVLIKHSDRKKQVDVLSHFMQIRNSKNTAWLKAFFNIENDSELRQYSQESINSGINTDSKFFALELQFTPEIILEFTNYFIEHIDTLTLTLQSYNDES